LDITVMCSIYSKHRIKNYIVCDTYWDWISCFMFSYSLLSCVNTIQTANMQFFDTTLIIDWLVFNTNLSSISVISWCIIWKQSLNDLVNVYFVGWLIVCIVLITDAWIIRNRRCDVTAFVNMVAALSAGNL
jgi:hypothetical protein